MAAAEGKTVVLHCPLRPENGGLLEEPTSDPCTEPFQKDAAVRTLDFADEPVNMQVKADLPSLNLAPPGYFPRRGNLSKPDSQESITNPTVSLSARRKRVFLPGVSQGEGQQWLRLEDCTSELDLFVMLRCGFSPTAEREMEVEVQDNQRSKTATSPKDSNDSQHTKPSWVLSPTVIDVFLTKQYQNLLGKVAHYGVPIMESLSVHGLDIQYGFSRLVPDDAKFFLKQQQKLLADTRDYTERENLLETCKLAACLYVLVSFADAVANISLSTGLRRFSILKEKYEDLIGGSLDLMKQLLAKTQLSLREQYMVHPKLQEMTRSVANWNGTLRKHKREKAVVVVGRDFSTVSGDILDFLQSITDLQSCVFSFECEFHNNPLYLDAVEERFHHYDCLVMPVFSIAANFPWEKVALLVEYEPLGSELWGLEGGRLPANLRLRHWVALRTMRDVSVAALAQSGSGIQSSSVMAFQYTLIASDNITRCSKLLQLLESRFNMLLISRDYDCLKKRPHRGPAVSYADLIVDQCSGIVVQPISLLSTDAGVHSLSTRATALSLQFEKLWIILYVEAEDSYPYGGCVPLNLARLHASVAHYCPHQDAYEVHIMCASSCEEAAYLVRRITEVSHRQNETLSEEEWRDREWIPDDLGKLEQFLLSFPCLNSFSAQMMLKRSGLGQILAQNYSQLQNRFPWLPQKVLKFFFKMSHVSFGQAPPLTALGQYQDASSPTLPHGNGSASLDDSLQCLSARDDLPYLEQQQNMALFVSNESSNEETLPPPGDLGAVSLENDPNLMLAASHTYPQHGYESHDSSMRYWAGASGVGSSTLGLAEKRSISQTDESARDGSGLRVYWPEDTESLEETVTPFTTSSFSSSPSILTWRQPQSRYSAHSSPLSKSTDSFTSPFSTNNPLKAHTQSTMTGDPSATVGGPIHFSTTQLGNSSAHSSIHSVPWDYYCDVQSRPSRGVTSAIVRHTPSREPVKSLDSEFRDPTLARGRQLLQANDRPAAAYCDPSAEGGRNQAGIFTGTVSVSGHATGQANGTGRSQVQGISALLDFHSQQSLKAPVKERGRSFSVAHPPSEIKTTRQKRPLSPSPVFDYQVPTYTASPQESAISLYFSSPTASLGSIRLSPLRKRRLVCKETMGSTNGQTKLAFE